MPYLSKTDQAAASRRAYVRNAGAYKARAVDAKRTQTEILTALARQAKDVPCADCGVRYPHYVMDFDHVEGEKLANLASMKSTGVGKQKFMDEIAKCEVVCSNCHRVRTWGEGGTNV
jgi:hypothetical protein